MLFFSFADLTLIGLIRSANLWIMNKTSKKYWLMKSEPDVFSIETLKKEKTTLWEGVRNYQARNYMSNDMSVGDEVLFYHSSTDPSSIVGLATVSQKAMPDLSQFNKKSEYFDAKATKEKPIWFCVEVKYKSTFKQPLTLHQIKEISALKEMIVIQKGSRLSIQPVTEKDFNYIVKNHG
jgi:predicted RNA-binding protein with PUA-like domain